MGNHSGFLSDNCQQGQQTSECLERYAHYSKISLLNLLVIDMHIQGQVWSQHLCSLVFVLQIMHCVNSDWVPRFLVQGHCEKTL